MALRITFFKAALISTLVAGGWLAGCGGKGGNLNAAGTGGTAGSGSGTGPDTTSGGGGAAPMCPGYAGPVACTWTATQPCYQGDPGTEGVGSCHQGTQSCAVTAFGACQEQGLPAPATCAAPTAFGCGAAPACGALAFQVVPPPHSDSTVTNGAAVALDAQSNILAVSTTWNAGGNVTISKLDPTGHPIWSKAFDVDGPAGGQPVAIQSVVVGADGRLILAGAVSGATVSFGGPTLGDPKDSRAMVVVLDAAGNHLWSKDFVATTSSPGASPQPYASISGVAADASGNVYLAGSFGTSALYGPTMTVTLDLGGAPLQGTSAVGAVGEVGQLGGSTAFVAKLDPSGDHLWSTSASGQDGATAAAVAVDAAGNVYVTGSSIYATGDLQSFTNVPCMASALLLASWDATGAVRWSKTFGSNRSGGSGTAIVASPSGDLYLVGSAGAGLDLGGGVIGSSAFAARFDRSGGHVWSMPIEDTSLPAGLGLDGAGNVVALTSAFRVVKIRPNGIPFASRKLSVTQSGSWTTLTASSVAVGAAGNLVVTGSYQGAVDFGLGSTPSTIPSNAYLLAIDP